jgi:hypothetical protein
MNKQDINWERVNRVLEEHVDLLCKSKLYPNQFRRRDNGSEVHENTCEKKIKELIDDGWVCYSQVKLINGNIADILAIDNKGNRGAKFVEIAKTESELSLNLKKEKYSLSVEVVKVE